MNKTPHTPGPWKSEDAKTPHGRPVIQKEIVAGIRHIADVRLYEDADLANARLIAAAPELLSALETIVRKSYLRPGKHEDCQIHPALIADARAAIAKAKGNL